MTPGERSALPKSPFYLNHDLMLMPEEKARQGSKDLGSSPVFDSESLPSVYSSMK